MNIEEGIYKAYLWGEKNIADLTAYSTAGIMYLSFSNEVLHSIFTVATAIVSFLSIHALKMLMKEINEYRRKDKNLKVKNKKDDEK